MTTSTAYNNQENGFSEKSIQDVSNTMRTMRTFYKRSDIVKLI